MNTPAHIIFGTAAFGRANAPWVTLAAVIGGVLPDVPLVLMVGWSILIQSIPAQTVFDSYYFSPEWQAVFAIDHGLLLWGAVLAFGVVLRHQIVTAFAGSGLLHAATDFLVHHSDARRQFWPLTDWIFRSPVSYWDRSHYGGIFGPVEIAVSLLLCGLLWHRYPSRLGRAGIVLLGLAELAPGILFGLMMHHG